ncbi:rab GTPase-binding effector protein 1-like, partial [Glandiceps talaboti]
MDNQQFVTNFSENMNQQGDEVSLLRAKVYELTQREQQWQQEKVVLEQEFGQKRAKFREIFLTRENELKQDIDKLSTELQKSQAELEDVRTV